MRIQNHQNDMGKHGAFFSPYGWHRGTALIGLAPIGKHKETALQGIAQKNYIKK